VGQREGGDRTDQTRPAAHQEQQRQHEQQVVDAEREVGACHLPPACRGPDGEHRRRRRKTHRLCSAVSAAHPCQYVCARRRQAVNPDLPSDETAAAAGTPALDIGATC